MPKRDVTGKAVEIASTRIQETLKAVRERVPLGPNKVEFTPSEFKRQLRETQSTQLFEMLRAGQITQEQVREALETQNGN